MEGITITEKNLDCFPSTYCTHILPEIGMSATKKSSFLQVTFGFGVGQGFSFSTCRPNPRCISFVVSAPQNFALRLDEAPGDKDYFCQDFCIPFSYIFITVIKLFSTRNNRLPKENHILVPKAGVVHYASQASER